MENENKQSQPWFKSLWFIITVIAVIVISLTIGLVLGLSSDSKVGGNIDGNIPHVPTTSDEVENVISIDGDDLFVRAEVNDVENINLYPARGYEEYSGADRISISSASLTLFATYDEETKDISFEYDLNLQDVELERVETFYSGETLGQVFYQKTEIDEVVQSFTKVNKLINPTHQERQSMFLMVSDLDIEQRTIKGYDESTNETYELLGEESIDEFYVADNWYSDLTTSEDHLWYSFDNLTASAKASDNTPQDIVDSWGFEPYEEAIDGITVIEESTDDVFEVVDVQNEYHPEYLSEYTYSNLF